VTSLSYFMVTRHISHRQRTSIMLSRWSSFTSSNYCLLCTLTVSVCARTMTKLCGNYLIAQSTVMFPLVLNFNTHPVPKDDGSCSQVWWISLWKRTRTATVKEVFVVVTHVIFGTDFYNCRTEVYSLTACKLYATHLLLCHHHSTSLLTGMSNVTPFICLMVVIL